MIAFAKKGKPRGDSTGRVTAYMGGAATSAAKVQRRPGVRGDAVRVYIPGEGWVTWQALQRSVDVAFEAWRVKKAQAGVIIEDCWERREMTIRRAVARKKPKAG